MNNLSQLNEQMNIVHGHFRKGLVARLIARISNWNQRRQAIRELHAMSDSLLNDLGIARYQIEQVVNQTGSFHELPVVPAQTEAVVPLQKAAA